MSDPLNDPRFPKRPQHPDFWRISEVVLQNDGASAEGKQPLEETVKDTVDLESLTYFAMQRGGMACQRARLPESLAPVLGSIWIDAFMAGAKFQQRGGHQ
jgi:hypothetical protein